MRSRMITPRVDSDCLDFDSPCREIAWGYSSQRPKRERFLPLGRTRFGEEDQVAGFLNGLNLGFLAVCTIGECADMEKWEFKILKHRI